MSTFVYPEFTYEQALEMATNGPADHANHIANLLSGMTLENYSDYLKVEWDGYIGSDKKQDPRPTLKVWIKNKNTGDIVRDVLITPAMKGKGFWGGTGNLGGSTIDALIPCEKQCHLSYKDAAARNNIVSNSLEEARNSIIAQSLFSTPTNVILEGKPHPDPTVNALAALERVAHFIISEKCKEQADGKSDAKRIDDMTANYCSGKPELVSKLGDKSKSLIFSYDRNNKKETDEEDWHCQTTMYHKAVKQARGKSLGGGLPFPYKSLFEESQKGEKPVLPFPFPLSVIAQEIKVVDEDEPIMDSAKTDKNGYIKYDCINLVNYKAACKSFGKSELARLTEYDMERRRLGSRVNGESILRIVATQSTGCCPFQIKISNLAVGLRWDSEFGFSYRVEGIMPIETEVADTAGVDLALKYASRKRKIPNEELDCIPEEEIDEDIDDDAVVTSKKTKLSEETVESDGEF